MFLVCRPYSVRKSPCSPVYVVRVGTAYAVPLNRPSDPHTGRLRGLFLVLVGRLVHGILDGIARHLVRLFWTLHLR